MTGVEYYVEVFSGGAWGIIPDCPPFADSHDAEAHRQKYNAQKGNPRQTRVTKYRLPVDVNMIPNYVKTPGHATVLLPPGLGDIHWVFLKLQGFLAQNGYTGADAWIWDAGGPRRSSEFVNRVPFVRFVDHVEFRSHRDRKALHDFCQQTNPIMHNKWGFDYVIALNGYLEAGLPLEPAMDNAPINWDYQINVFPLELAYGYEERQRGPWILLYFSGLGQVFAKWTEIITPAHVATLIQMMNLTWPGHRIKMVGLPWDQGFTEQIHGVRADNLVGKTNPDQYFALLRGADAMVGFANGNTILTTHFGVPTIMIWNGDRYPHGGFRTNWVGPRENYHPVEIDDFDPLRIIEVLTPLMESKELVNA